MAEQSLEEIAGKVRRLTGGLASSQLLGGNDGTRTAESECEQMRLRGARLIEEALGGHLRQSLERIEAAHQQKLNELSRDEAAMFNRLREELDQALKRRQEDDRDAEERMVAVALASVEQRFLPQFEEVRLLLKQQQAELSYLTERPSALSSNAVFWLCALAAMFIGGALFAPELAQVLEAALGAFR